MHHNTHTKETRDRRMHHHTDIQGFNDMGRIHSNLTTNRVNVERKYTLI